MTNKQAEQSQVASSDVLGQKQQEKNRLKTVDLLLVISIFKTFFLNASKLLGLGLENRKYQLVIQLLIIIFTLFKGTIDQK